MDFNLILSLSAHNSFCTSTRCWSRKSGTLVSYESWHLCLRKGAFTSLVRVGWVSEGDESGARCGPVVPPIVPPHNFSTAASDRLEPLLPPPIHNLGNFQSKKSSSPYNLRFWASLCRHSDVINVAGQDHLQKTLTNNLSPLNQTKMYAY